MNLGPPVVTAVVRTALFTGTRFYVSSDVAFPFETQQVGVAQKIIGANPSAVYQGLVPRHRLAG